MQDYCSGLVILTSLSILGLHLSYLNGLSSLRLNLQLFTTSQPIANMLTPSLHSTYLQYKQDTKFLATYLVQTAKGRGYSSKESTVPTSSEKNAKTYPLSTDELLTLAQYLAECEKPPIVIASSFVSTIKRTIKARQLTSTCYVKNASDVDKKDGHRYFINMLQTILELLGPKVPVLLPPSPKVMNDPVPSIRSHIPTERTSEDSDLDSLVSKLEDVELEVLLPDAPKKQQAQPKIVKEDEIDEFTADDMKEEEKCLFALRCFLQDVHAIAAYVSQLWSLYVQGEAELVSTAMAAQWAIELVRQLERDFVQEFPYLAGMDRIISSVCAERNFSKLGREFDACLGLPSSETNDKVRRAGACFFPMYRRIKKFAEAFDTTAKPAYYARPGNIQAIRPSANFAQTVTEDDQLFDWLTPMLHWELVFCKNEAKTSSSIQDLFVLGLRQCHKDGHFPMWVVVAGQCFLNTLHATKSAPEKAFVDLGALGLAIRASATETLETKQNRDKRLAVLDKSLRENVVNRIDAHFFQDPFHTFIETRMRRKKGGVPPPFTRLKDNPLMCGLRAFKLLLDVQDCGIKYANGHAAIMSTVHLMNAIRKERDSALVWPELDFMVDPVQPTNHLFVGGSPSTPEQYFSNICLMSGMSAVAFAKNQRPLNRIAKGRDMRELSSDLNVVSPLRHMLQGKTQLNFSELQKFLNDRYRRHVGFRN